MVLRVLVIDQNRKRAEIVEAALRADPDVDVQIAAVSSGQLLPLLRQAAPDVLIVDLDLPDRDTIEQLRIANREFARPVVLFVDESDTEAMRTAVSAGVSAYVVDGLQPRRVKAVLEVAVARFQEFERLRRELDLARTSLAERKLIDRAKGILMRARGMNEEDAYNLLRSKAMKDQKKVAEIAQSVITASELLK
ncbi:ANTAR domain-containing response regulator [Ancylobacter polymorphus]|uniref:ANTAR domain-containing protein n=1 Tax=Ancylobacter polymorphus TaxID=223390 RepID=A0A9E7A4L3_9HYPH|nr:ANTAR domain-containing protein [Ancylobacter polymorphus]UOK73075.1 ANTAR domain-containing protein [Ancylobacter polymorphus]